MTLTNSFILEYTQKLNDFLNDETIKFPARVNYSIQKNFRNLVEIYNELIQERLTVYEKYSTSQTDDGNYKFEDEEKLQQANQELLDLFNGTQEVNILKFNIDSLGDMPFNSKQMDILMFMIED